MNTKVEQDEPDDGATRPAETFRWIPRPRQLVRNAASTALAPWVKSIALEDLAALDLDGIDIVSLDVFDTCLGRLVGDPVDVFRLVGRRAPDDVTANVPEWDGEEWFARQRVEAERRRRPPAGEVTFDEIWDEMATSIPDPAAREYLRDDELTVESIVSVGRRAVREFVERAALSTAIVYLSDMYLDAATIAALLNAAGFPNAPVVVSSETGATKRSGAAFRLLCERYAVAPQRVLHVGDNFMADGWAAARAGVRARIVPTWRDRAVTAAPLSTPAPVDDGIALALAAHMAHNDGAPESVDEPDETTDRSLAVARRCGQAALGPLQIGFTHWLFDSLPRDLPKLFAARDMRGTLDLFHRIGDGRHTRDGRIGDPAASEPASGPTWYLDGSRRAFVLAAMANGITDEDRDGLLAGRGLISERDIWLRLGFDATEEPVRSADDTPRPFHDRSVMWESVLRYSDLVVERAQHELDELGIYWDRQGLPLTGRAAYIDLGWRGTAQRLVERCVEALGGDLALDGYYLALVEEPPPGLRSGARGWIVDRGFPITTRIGVEAGIPIWELAFQASEGSTRSYRNGQPVRGPAPTSRPIQDALQYGGLQYADAWFELAARLGVYMSPGTAVAQPMLRLVNTPTREEATVLGQMDHTDQPGDAGIHPVLEPPEHPLIHPRRSASWLRRSEWRPGSIAATGLNRLGIRLVSGGLGGLKLLGFALRARRRAPHDKPSGQPYTKRVMSSGGDRAHRDGE